MRTVGLLLAVLLASAACSPAAAITEDQKFWCRTSQEALAFDYFSETFEELHGVSMIEAKAEFGYKKPAVTSPLLDPLEARTQTDSWAVKPRPPHGQPAYTHRPAASAPRQHSGVASTE